MESATISKQIAVEFDPFAGPEIVRLAPVTESQAEIWIACLLGGEDASRAYNESVSLLFTGPLDRPALQRALQEVINRHEALRCAFSADGKHLCVFGTIEAACPYHDGRTQTSQQTKQLLESCLREDAHHVFDLIRGSLIKFTLIQLSDTQHHFIVTAHHVICDGWSIGIMLQDISKLYSAYTQNLLPVLPTPINFSQYADEQAAFSTSAEYTRTKEFWVQQYQAGAPFVELPLDFPRPPQRTYQSARLDFPVSQELVAKIKQTGLRANCSFVTTLMACFEIVMHQATGQQAIVTGLPAAGQSATGNYYLLGHCVNLLPLRSELLPDDSFNDFLQRRKSYLFNAYEHQQLTFGALLKKINIPRDPARIPLVPVLFNVDMGLANDVDFYNLRLHLHKKQKLHD